MPNPNPKTDHLKPTQFKRKRPDKNDYATMLDMIQSGTSCRGFQEFWSGEAGYTKGSLHAMYYEIKSGKYDKRIKRMPIDITTNKA